jgi:hypothetical protein
LDRTQKPWKRKAKTRSLSGRQVALSQFLPETEKNPCNPVNPVWQKEFTNMKNPLDRIYKIDRIIYLLPFLKKGRRPNPPCGGKPMADQVPSTEDTLLPFLSFIRKLRKIRVILLILSKL